MTERQCFLGTLQTELVSKTAASSPHRAIIPVAKIAQSESEARDRTDMTGIPNIVTLDFERGRHGMDHPIF